MSASKESLQLVSKETHPFIDFDMEAPNSLLIKSLHTDLKEVEYLRKEFVVDAIKLAWGTVSMNPFDCDEAFKKLLNKVGYEIH